MAAPVFTPANNAAIDGGATALLSATAVGTYTTPLFVNASGKYKGVEVVIDVTVGGTLTATIEEHDPMSGKKVTILASTALGVTTQRLRVYPTLTASANVAANDILPPQFDLKLVVATSAVTATISINPIL